VSDTRTPETDSGGALLAELLERAGHPVVGRDDRARRARRDRGALDRRARRARASRPVLLTGGTGVAPRDRTPEAIEPRLERVIPGFGELFRALSYQEIGSAALLSRALGGIAAGRVVLAYRGRARRSRSRWRSSCCPELGHSRRRRSKTG
jgi:molybdenum cofactor biosynthesis protein B